MDYFKNRRQQQELRVRDSKGRPYYLKKLPFHRRNPKAFVGTAGIAVFLVLFSAPIYHALFTTEEDIGPQGRWWPHEIAKGKSQLEVWREKLAKENEDKAQGRSAWTDFFTAPPKR